MNGRAYFSHPQSQDYRLKKDGNEWTRSRIGSQPLTRKTEGDKVGENVGVIVNTFYFKQ